MGIYNQHFVERLPMNQNPVEYLRHMFQKEDYQSIRNRLGKYGLEGHAHEVTMRDLSGGQKARVVLVELSLQEPHVLLLDEPTNVSFCLFAHNKSLNGVQIKSISLCRIIFSHYFVFVHCLVNFRTSTLKQLTRSATPSTNSMEASSW